MNVVISVTGGYDYKPGPFNVTIPAGEISVSFNISIINDYIFERNESFSLTIDSSSLPDKFLLQPDCEVIVTIVDDDGKSLCLHSFRSCLYIHTFYRNYCQIW